MNACVLAARRCSQYIERKRVLVQTCHLAHLSVGRSVGQSVCLSVRGMYCRKTADWIWMVSGVGRGMGVLDRRRRRDSCGGKYVTSHLMNGDFVV